MDEPLGPLCRCQSIICEGRGCLLAFANDGSDQGFERIFDQPLTFCAYRDGAQLTCTSATTVLSTETPHGEALTQGMSLDSVISIVLQTSSRYWLYSCADGTWAVSVSAYGSLAWATCDARLRISAAGQVSLLGSMHIHLCRMDVWPL